LAILLFFFILGILPMHHFHPDVIRWSLTAHDICFTNTLHSQFFARGNCVPVIRGAGVYQQGLDMCVTLMNQGKWVHIFPEGKVNMDNTFIRFKWGIGRLIAESQKLPLIIPMWHCGMDKVLPNTEPYRFNWGQEVLLNIGKPIDLTEVVNSPPYLEGDDKTKRKLITDRIQVELMNLKEQTEKLYSQLKS
jgi:monolysocardiolipin acyltransferase